MDFDLESNWAAPLTPHMRGRSPSLRQPVRVFLIDPTSALRISAILHDRIGTNGEKERCLKFLRGGQFQSGMVVLLALEGAEGPR